MRPDRSHLVAIAGSVYRPSRSRALAEAVAFVEQTDILGDRTADQWQQDAFGQVDAWLRALGMRG